MACLEKVMALKRCLSILGRGEFMTVYLVGIGMGNADNLTIEAKDVINNADVIIGAKRMTESIGFDKTVFNSYNSCEIADYLKGASFSKAVVLLSGDVGFYSGAKRLLAALGDFDVRLVPGISSPVYFCSKLKIGWEDVKLLSLHGKKQNIVMYIKRYKKVFALLGKGEDIKNLCEKLVYYGLDDVVLHIGQRLSYCDEKIVTAKAGDIKNFDFSDLSVVLAENERCEDNSLWNIDDECFIRDDVPMTKSEVRSLSIAKLRLSADSVLYDIGAGTGSVSVEAALKLIDGEVYSVEKSHNAVCLIEKNKRKFAADNINIVEGNAAEVLEKLPAPTHVFVGGSSGELEKIIECALKKNPSVRIVVNAVSLNTLGEVMRIALKFGLESDIVCLNVSKNRKIGRYELMTGLNPVYIFTLERR